MTKLSSATRHSPSSRQNKKESNVLGTVGLDLRFQAKKDSNTLGQQDLWLGGGGMGAQRPGLRHTPLHTGVGFSETEGWGDEVLTFHNRCLNPLACLQGVASPSPILNNPSSVSWEFRDTVKVQQWSLSEDRSHLVSDVLPLTTGYRGSVWKGYLCWQGSEDPCKITLINEFCKMLFCNVKEVPMWLRGKESACQCRKCSFYPWVGKIPEVEMATHSRILA